MYIPKANRFPDQHEIAAFMQRFSFATIVTSRNDIPTATHLPFLVEFDEGEIVLTSHFARANEQWKDISHAKVLIIFSEPHAYISPSHYERQLEVPTWNYISVHAYGSAQIAENERDTMNILERTIDRYETDYRVQWDASPIDYKRKMSEAIVAFRIKVSDLQAKKKLSQNKTEGERRNIIHSLSDSSDSAARAIAEYMMRDLQR